MSTKDITKEQSSLAVFRAKKFALWLFIIASIMIFASLSSGYIVYTANGVDKGIKIILPKAFIWSTIFIVLSSITVHMAYLATKKELASKRRLYLLISIALGTAFFVSQFNAWKVLVEQGAYFINNNASQSFIYVFTGFHLAHILGGVIVLLVAFFRKTERYTSAQNIASTELGAMFWHFLDILWIYIYVFLLLNQ